jgi:hypothetical protein
MNIATCPHCRMRVIPTADGFCPSCRSKIAAEGSQPVLTNPFADPHQESASTSVETARADNPYASSLTPEIETASRNPLLIPAWFLLVGSVLWFLVVVLVAGQHMITREVLVRLPQPNAVGELTGFVLMSLLPVVTITGAVSMLNRQSFRWAWTGACVALIPACGPCYGFLIPFAIWAIVLLWCRDVKESFRRSGF